MSRKSLRKRAIKMQSYSERTTRGSSPFGSMAWMEEKEAIRNRVKKQHEGARARALKRREVEKNNQNNNI